MDALVPPIRTGQIIASRYEILSPLGRGGMGAVYRAYDQVLEEEVALKVLREEGGRGGDAARRFRTEIKLARRVIHRNVCRIFEYGEDEGRRFISMELIEGSELKRHAGALSMEQAFAVAVQIADGLDAIHRVGVIHRDLKTSNIMLDPSGTVRLMDFGIAKHVAPDAVAATATGHIIGTPAYMSPEQARAEKLDFRSDIYSLGVVLYELFSGRVPFEGDTPLSVILKHLHDPPPLEGPSAEKLPPSLVPLLSRALAKSRGDRFQTAAELGQALRTAAAGAMGGPTSPTMTLTTTASAITMGASPTEVHVPETTLKRTAELREKPARTGGRGRAVAAAAIGALIVAAVAFRLLPRRSGAVAIEPSPSAVAVSAPPVVAARALVTLNALPWARISVKSSGPNAEPPAGRELVTPCAVELGEGTYTLELENGGLTPPLTREIHVAAGGRNEFVFTMPSFDPARAAQTATEGRP